MRKVMESNHRRLFTDGRVFKARYAPCVLQSSVTCYRQSRSAGLRNNHQCALMLAHPHKDDCTRKVSATESLYCPSLSPLHMTSTVRSCSYVMCLGGDSNSQSSRRWLLRPECIPVPPPRQLSYLRPDTDIPFFVQP